MEPPHRARSSASVNRAARPLAVASGIGTRRHNPRRSERRVLIGPSLDDVAAGTDVGRNTWDPGGAPLKQDERLRLANAGQSDCIHPTKVFPKVHSAEEHKNIAQAEMRDHLLAFVE